MINLSFSGLEAKLPISQNVFFVFISLLVYLFATNGTDFQIISSGR